MNIRTILLVSLLVSLVLWGFFAWPLPLHFFNGIPSSAHNIEKDHTRTMIPGDHFQLMYYFWIAGDMVIGRTPLLYDLYEFNAGDDEDTYRPHHYFIPFSLLYAALTWVGNRAFAWNIASFVAVWLTYLTTWLLARRYSDDDLVAAVAALVGVLIPFRWLSLLGGSPMGFGLQWIPVLFLGLDMAVRDGRPSGGLLTGLALLLSRFSDVHLLFFGVWAAPAWCLLAFLYRKDFNWKRIKDYVRIVLALLPALVGVGLAVEYTIITHQRVGESLMSGGRTIKEIALFSPEWTGLLGFHSLTGPSCHIYVGWMVPGVILCGLIALIVARVRRKPWQQRRLLALVLLILGATGVAVLALGPFGPDQGRVFMWARKGIPQYTMIRQSAKIFCIMGPLLTVAVALSLSSLTAGMRRKGWRAAAVLLVGLLITEEYRLRISPTICDLEEEQEAYHAVAEDAAAHNMDPHILVVPLWPGDSAYSSIYQYYVTLYRIRMVNGYNPIVSKRYYNEVFKRFSSANKGVLEDKQLDTLLENGIHYVLVHEDLFPEKVSPFPVSFTIESFMHHPRMDFMKQSGPIWAFKIRNAPRKVDEKDVTCKQLFPARRWEVEGRREDDAVTRDETAGGGAYVTLADIGSRVGTRRTGIPEAPGLRWMVRARGRGLLNAEMSLGDHIVPLDPLLVDSDDWTWLEAPFAVVHHERAKLVLSLQDGSVDVDMVVLGAGAWQSPAVGETISLPASCFFHAGYSDRRRHRVFFRKDWDPMAIVFYGPKLPLEKGTYELEFEFASSAESGIELGRFNIRLDEHDESGWVDVIAGKPIRHRFTQEHNLPMLLAFHYLRNGDMEIDGVKLRRVE